MIAVNQNLVYLRERAGLTQEQASKLLTTTSRETVSRERYKSWEEGACFPPTRFLNSICEVFHHNSIDSLLKVQLNRQK